MRRTLLAGCAALALLTATPRPASAMSWDRFMELVTDLYEGDTSSLLGQLHSLFGIYGSASISYLRRAERVLDQVWPDRPRILSIDGVRDHVEERLEGGKGIVAEAMGTASTVLLQQPFNQLKLMTLQAANVSPVSLFAAIQIGNEVEAEATMALHKMNGLIAEMGQMEADERMSEEWQKVANHSWSQAHYQDTAFWAGERTWEPDTVDTGW